MDYLLLQILLFLILAAVIGFFIGWITRGLGFESRLLASENQWRARHHVLQSENNRLQTELDAAGQEKSKSLLNIQDDDIAISLPFSSTQEPTIQEPSVGETTQHSDPEPVLDLPLEKLRSKPSQIGKTHSEEQISVQTEIFDESTSSRVPTSLDQPDGEPDDLKTIKGIGPKIESTLYSLGIYHFSQIADFTEADIKWVNEHMQFNGRIEREKWIDQAQTLINNSGA